MPGYDEKKPDRLKPAAARKQLFRSCLSETVVSKRPFRSCLLETVFDYCRAVAIADAFFPVFHFEAVACYKNGGKSV